jgi:hypothetical protein
VTEKLALYFGYMSGGGHFLQGLPRYSLDPERDCPGFPWSIRLLDTGLLENRRVPDNPDGRVHWTCGGRPELWFAFFWWDRSGDKRGASNSGFYVRGFEPPVLNPESALAAARDAFAYACEQWPDVVERQLYPLMLVATEGP